MTHDEDDDRRQSASDRDLGMDRSITRRDFLNGVAIGVGGALAGGLLAGIPGLDALLAAAGLAQDAPAYYPPAQTGMRGSHDGSFEVSHALRDGRFWTTAGQPVGTGETYDLVVVGGGISGLAAAYFYRARMPSARILILDNHDDFGGHAKRNEFRPGGKTVDCQRRHRRHRVAVSVQQRSTQADARARDRSRRAVGRRRPRRRPVGLSRTAERHVLRQGNIRRRSARGRHARRRAAAAGAAARRVRRGRSSSPRRRCRPTRRRTSRVSRRRASTTCRVSRTRRRKTASRA